MINEKKDIYFKITLQNKFKMRIFLKSAKLPTKCLDCFLRNFFSKLTIPKLLLPYTVLTRYDTVGTVFTSFKNLQLPTRFVGTGTAGRYGTGTAPNY